MAGNRHSGMVLQRRDEHLLTELGVMRIIDREMASVVVGFHSVRRANARLLQLTRGGLLRRFFVGSIAHGRKAVYTLSPKGKDFVNAKLGGIHRGSERLIVGDLFVEHQTAINRIYMAVKYHPTATARFIRWFVFRESISEAIKLTPDAYFEITAGGAVRAIFLEVDRGTEPLKIWQQKIACYIQLAISGEFARRFRQPQFRVLVVVTSERRLSNIRATVAKSTDKIFWLTTLEKINREGLWSPIWLRPAGDQRLSLL